MLSGFVLRDSTYDKLCLEVLGSWSQRFVDRHSFSEVHYKVQCFLVMVHQRDSVRGESETRIVEEDSPCDRDKMLVAKGFNRHGEHTTGC